MRRINTPLGVTLAMGALAAPSLATDILVYNNNTQHSYAETAAMNVDAAGTVIADTNTFDTLLSSQAWDVVLVDCPSTIPVSGWSVLESYVAGGGKVVMGYWDWDAYPTLMTSFGVSLINTISLVGNTVFDSATSPVFTGVTMPNGDWHNHWGDDGDTFNPGAGTGLAHIGLVTEPVMVLGNGGNTICSFVIDEAGDVWDGDGSAVQLWENMMTLVGTGGSGVGTSYCSNNPNSTGSPASLSIAGSDSVATNDFTLTSAPVPDQPSIFFYGHAQIQVPFGDGFLCVSSNLVRTGVVVGSGNQASIVLDTVAEGFVAGQTRYFQHWFRDPAAGGTGWNTSDGVGVVFTP